MTKSPLNIARLTLYAVFAATTLVLSINVDDSTILKLPILVVLTLVLAAMGCARLLQEEAVRPSLSAIDVAVWGLYASAVLSILVADNLRLSLGYIGQLTCLVILYISSGVAIVTSVDRRKFAMVIALTTAIVSAIGLAQAFIPSMREVVQISSGRDVVSTLGNAAYLAGYLVMVFPVVLALAATSTGRKRYLYLALAVSIVLLLIRTEARSSWIALAGSLVVFVMMGTSKAGHRLLVAVAMVAMATVAYLLFPDIIRERIGGMLDISTTSSISRRFQFYEGAWNAFLSSPLIGHGAGNFMLFLPRYRSPDFWMSRAEDIVPHAHNEFLEILSETGIVGFIFFAAVLIFGLSSLRKRYLECSADDRMLFVGFGCGLIAIILDNLGNVTMRTVPVAVGFWMMLGIFRSPSGRNFRSFVVPVFLKRLRFVPYILAAVMLIRYVPGELSAFRASGKYLQGITAHWYEWREIAQQHFRESLRFDPRHYQSRFYLASSLTQTRDYTDAKNHLDTLLAAMPYYPKAKLMRSIAGFELGDTSGAMRDVRDELAMNTAPLTLYYYSYFAYRMRRPDLEYEMVSRLLENAVRSGSAEFVDKVAGRMSDLCRSEDKREECGGLLDEVQKAFSEDALVGLTIAEVYWAWGNFREARELLETVRKSGVKREWEERFERLSGAMGVDSAGHH